MKKALSISIAVLVFSLGIVFLSFAWTSPTLPAPQGNVSAPINVGTIRQSKEGSFVAGGLSSNGALFVTGDALVIGNITTHKAFFYASDEKIKENIKPFNRYSKLFDLDAVSYTHKLTGEDTFGLIAQDVEKIYPELVYDNGGFKSLDYGRLVVPLIEVVKDQEKEIENLRKEIEEIKIILINR